MNKIKRLIITTIASLGFVVPILSPAVVRAATPVDPPAPAAEASTNTQVNTNLNCGANLSFDKQDCENTEAGGEVDNIITAVINVISLVVGVVAVIMIIVGGLRYITSSGESGNVSGAKNTILYAVIGLIVVALAQLIVRWVVNEATPAAADA